MLVRAKLPESFLAEGQKAERRTFRAVRQDAQVPHEVYRPRPRPMISFMISVVPPNMD